MGALDLQNFTPLPFASSPGVSRKVLQSGGIGEFTLTTDTSGTLPLMNLFEQRLDSYN